MGNSGNQSVRILVVDRDAETGERLSRFLMSEGFQCESTTSSLRALALARVQMPSLMIVDTQLDGGQGFDFARHVMQEYPRHDIPVIFVSQDGGQEIVDQSRNAGGIYFLSKPIDPSVLLELVDKSLWMPHLVRRHIDAAAHPVTPKTPRVLAEAGVAAARLATDANSATSLPLW